MIAYVGRLYQSRSEGAGWFMLMKKDDNRITLSPLFWRGDEVVYVTYPREVFVRYFKEVDDSKNNWMFAKTRGAYDWETVKRWGIINRGYHGTDE